MKLELQFPIETRRLQLRIVEEADVEDLVSVNGDEAVTHFLPYPTWRSLEDGLAWFDRMVKVSETGETLQLVIIERESDRVVGSCLLLHYDEASARAEIGYVMGRAHWKKGFTHEALTALITYAFEKYELRRIEAEINPENIASSRLISKLGFTCEGLLRQRWMEKGKAYDTSIFGLLREEWSHVS